MDDQNDAELSQSSMISSFSSSKFC